MTNLEQNNETPKFGEFKGTKGKWYADKLDDIFIRSEENKCNICTMDGANYKYAEKTANAQLISKAPEMLDMLKELISENTWENNWSEKKEKAIKLIKQATEL